MFSLSNPRQAAVGAVLTIAFAGEAQSPSIPTIADTIPVARPVALAAHQKSVGEAVMISVASTYGPVVVAYATHNTAAEVAAGAGVLIGPSTGYWYSDSPKWKGGLITRSVGAGVGTLGLALTAPCFFSENQSSGCVLGGVLAVAGAATVVVSGIIDIARLPNAVRAERAPVLSVAPIVGAGAKSAGLAAQLRF